MRRSVHVLFGAFALLLLHTAAVPADASPTQPQVTAALNALFTALAGSNWGSKKGWNTTAPYCDTTNSANNWYGITCQAGTTTLTQLLLGNNNLGGTIPSDIGVLTDLQVLSLPSNDIGGSLPATISNLVNLQQFDIGNNNIAGSITAAMVTAFTKLTLFRADSTQMGGQLPTGMGAWTQLQHFHVEESDFQGPLPSDWSGWAQLQTLRLASNFLTGSLPQSWFTMTALTTLDVSGNELSGPLPTNWSTMTNMQLFLGQMNSFSGPLPPQWASWTQVQSLDLSRTAVSGPIPTGWFSAWPQLTNFRIAGARLSGSLPPTIAFSSTVVHFDVSSNSLSGTLPAGWSILGANNLVGQATVLLSYNRFTGGIPDSWGSWTGIVEFQAASAGLSGALPPTLGSWVNATVLNLNANAFESEIPLSYYQLKSLTRLQLAANKLYGSVPDYGVLANLKTLMLNNNYFSGSVPTAIFALGGLQSLYLNNNQLQQLPAAPTIGSSLTTLDVSVNNIEGTLPVGFGTRTIQHLHLSSNKFFGTLPPSWCNASALQHLDLSNNFLFGTIPTQWDSAGLMILDISQNFFFGAFPVGVMTMPNLYELDLGGNGFNVSLSGTVIPSNTQVVWLNASYNYFGGGLPTGWERVSPFEYLDLSHNALDGTLPAEWGTAQVSDVIDLSFNSLTGTVPTTWASHNYTTYFDLSHNNVMGTLPAWGANGEQWQDLAIIDLSHNYFSGTLPASWSNVFPDLFELDLNVNQLTGGVPDSWTSFPSLERFTVVCNQLSGPLPFQNVSTSDDPVLEELFLSSNNFMGTVPASWSNLPYLRSIFVSSNFLGGTLPDSWSLLPLEQVDVSGNFFIQGTIPASWANSSTSSAFFFGFNAAMTQLKGPFPANWRTNMPDLMYLHLAGTQLGSSIPNAQFPSLTELSLDFVQLNDMDGHWFPEALMGSQFLEALSMRNTGVQGPIPTLLSSYFRLYDISQNNIYGDLTVRIPDATLTPMAYLSLEPSNTALSSADILADLSKIPSASKLVQTGPFTWRNPYAYAQTSVVGLVPIVRLPDHINNNQLFPPAGAIFLTEAEHLGLTGFPELFLTNEVTLQYALFITPYFTGEAFGKWGQVFTVNDAAMGWVMLDNGGYNLIGRHGVTYTITAQFTIRVLRLNRAETITVKSGPIRVADCLEGLYAVPGTGLCIPCPENAACNGSTTFSTTTSAWAPSATSLPLVTCDPYNEGCAPVGTENASTCLPGYKGYRCSNCDEAAGYHKSSRGCATCNAPLSAVAKFLLIVLMVAAVVGLVRLTAPEGEEVVRPARREKALTATKFVFNIFGFLGILAAAPTAQVLAEVGWFMLDFEGFIGGATYFRQLLWSCGFLSYNSETQVDWAICTFVVLLAVAFVPIIYNVWKRPPGHGVYFAVLAGVAVVTHLSYVSVAVTTSRVMTPCVTSEFRSVRSIAMADLPFHPPWMPTSTPSSQMYGYLGSDPSVSCPVDSSNGRWFDGAAALNIIIGLIFPILFVVLHMRIRVRDSAVGDSVMHWYALGYRSSAWPWEYVLLLRKWVLIVAVTLAPDESKMTFVAAVLGLGLYLHERFRPYKNTYLQLGESLALALAFLTACILSLSTNVADTTAAASVIFVLHLLGWIGIFILTVKYIRSAETEEDELLDDYRRLDSPKAPLATTSAAPIARGNASASINDDASNAATQDSRSETDQELTTVNSFNKKGGAKETSAPAPAPAEGGYGGL